MQQHYWARIELRARCLPSTHESGCGFSHWHQNNNHFIDRESCLLGWLTVTVIVIAVSDCGWLHLENKHLLVSHLIELVILEVRI